MNVTTKQDFLADIRAQASDMLAENPTSGRAAVLLGLVALARGERLAQQRESFERITALRMALREIDDGVDVLLENILGQYVGLAEHQARRIREQARAALEQDGAPQRGSWPEKPPRDPQDREWA